MNENDKSSFAKVLPIVVPIVSVLVALASLLVGIAARKKELTCTLLSSSSIVSANPNGINPDIKVEFRGQQIVSLSKLTFSLKNSGSGAVRVGDVTEPVRVVFPSQNRVLNSSVDGTLPQHFTFSVKLDPISNAVLCDFPLLNAGDEAFFSVYVQAPRNVGVSFEGRVVDVPQMPYVDKSNIEATRMPQVLSSHAVRMILRWVLVIIYAGVAIVFIILWLRDIKDEIVYRKWRRAHKVELDKNNIWHVKNWSEVQSLSIQHNIKPPPVYGWRTRNEGVIEGLTITAIVFTATLTAWIVFWALGI
ncbi:MAG TPA: hypothetical protein VG759_17980 [Candidatus Angelobacter sp.]|jgi:hypothetical protein|nr:hypothetical protein [Candidatus Angelobacter sp.]